MPDNSPSIEEILAALAATPSRLAALTAGLDRALLRTRPAPDEWSAVAVLAHMRACADMWGTAIRTILAEDHPTIRAVNPRSWIKQTDYPDLEFVPSLHAFTAQRVALLAVLDPLPPEDWERAATVTGAGKVLERTVLFYAEWLAHHERPHVKQIARVVTRLAG
jgi:hypothetical protein